ncbi:hypothetical protein LOK49_Contig490G00003 [Camellia lanceoleosa]|nr:hypothetical protein LOK49_Contig490G00003 [Camellia lanceoleosa]
MSGSSFLLVEGSTQMAHKVREQLNLAIGKPLGKNEIFVFVSIEWEVESDDESEEESEFQLTCDFLHIIVLMVLVPLPGVRNASLKL